MSDFWIVTIAVCTVIVVWRVTVLILWLGSYLPDTDDD